jgi:Uma2 family endonuclease
MAASTMTPLQTFDNVAELWHSLGEVPLERIVMNPLPGTATEQDLLRFVDRDKHLVELVEGTLVEKPVGLFEALIATNLVYALRDFVTPRKLGLVFGADATLRMAAGNVRLPDVTFIGADELPDGELPAGAIQTLPPTLAVEVISESNTKAEMRKKIKEYFESRTRVIWLVYPKARTVAVYDEPSAEPAKVLNETDTLDGGVVLPGFAIPVADIFKKRV